MSNLPNHIADMCGVVMTVQEAIQNHDFKSVQLIRDDERTVSIKWRDQQAGWIQEMPKDSEGRQYRALTHTGQIKRFYTVSSAMDWLLAEMA